MFSGESRFERSYTDFHKNLPAGINGCRKKRLVNGTFFGNHYSCPGDLSDPDGKKKNGRTVMVLPLLS